MNFQTIHQKDFEDIRSLWGEIFGKQHPIVEKRTNKLVL